MAYVQLFFKTSSTSRVVLIIGHIYGARSIMDGGTPTILDIFFHQIIKPSLTFMLNLKLDL